MTEAKAKAKKENTKVVGRINFQYAPVLNKPAFDYHCDVYNDGGVVAMRTDTEEPCALGRINVNGSLDLSKPDGNEANPRLINTVRVALSSKYLVIKGNPSTWELYAVLDDYVRMADRR